MKEEAIKAPLAESGETMTVSELFESWLTSEKDNFTEETLHSTCLSYLAFLKPAFGDRRVNDILFKEWTEFTKSVPTSEKTLLGKVAADSFQNALKAFKRMFAYGKSELGLNDPTVKVKIVVKDPSAEINNDRFIFSPDVTVFTDDEVEKMKAHMIWYNNTHICIMLGLCAGLSQSEIAGLKWKDIDPESGLVKVRRIYYRKDVAGKKELVECPPKNKSGIRDIPIPDWFSERLASLKAVYDDEDYVYTGKKEPLVPIAFVYSFFPKFLDWSGVEHKPFTALKNTFVKQRFDSGTDIDIIRRLIGEVHIKNTIARYFEIKR